MLIIYLASVYLYAKDERMNIENVTFWEHLADDLAPMMQVGESLINETLSLIEKYDVDIVSITDWKELPATFQNEIRACIANVSDDIFDISSLGAVLQTDVLYQSVFETLETQYARLDKKDMSARSFLLYLMEEIMQGSISTGIMSLSDWHDLLEKRKETLRVDDVGEYVYKKMCNVLIPEEKLNIYDFFYNNIAPAEIDKLLDETKDSLLLASAQRGQTKKRGQGMSRFIIDCIHHWQAAKLLKPLKSIFPFCQCLQAHWNNEINLGTRQGLEATYKQKF